MSIALAAYKPHRLSDVGGYAICAWTRKKYSHVEIMIDGRCYSSSLWDGGVRNKYIDVSADWWDVFPIEWATRDFALDVYSRYDGMGYGWLDLITQHILKLPITDPRPVCSELAALMIGLPESISKSVSPGDLVDYVRNRNAG